MLLVWERNSEQVIADKARPEAQAKDKTANSLVV
jgi:hypothetical protein